VSAINQYYDYCLVPHGDIKSVFEKSGVQIPISVIHQGFMRYKRGRRNMGVEQCFRIGFLGNLDRRNNFLKLHQACSNLLGKIPGVKLVVHVSYHGDSIVKSEITALKSASFIEWSEGRLTVDEIGEWYRNLSCFVLPSSGAGWSFTPRESLYLGVPTVLTDIPVHDELVASGYCRVIPTKGFEAARFEGRVLGKWYGVEVEEIEKAILELYEKYGRYQIEALKGSRWIESKWSNESMQQSILKFFSSI
jgi:glycosyltransferase involved in cell wall biosynthesis